MPSIEELEKMVKKLQEIMRIQDWDIYVYIVDKHKMKDLAGDKDYYTGGYCISDLNKNNAFVYLNQDNEGTQNNLYLTIVHELFHIVTARHRFLSDRFEDKDLTSLLQVENENLIEHLAKIFVSIYPESKIKEDLI